MTTTRRTRTRPVNPDIAVECTVAQGYWIYDPIKGEQVTGGATVMVRASNVERWRKNGWLVAEAEPDEFVADDLANHDVDVDTTSKVPRPRKTAAAKQ